MAEHPAPKCCVTKTPESGSISEGHDGEGPLDTGARKGHFVPVQSPVQTQGEKGMEVAVKGWGHSASQNIDLCDPVCLTCFLKC